MLLERRQECTRFGSTQTVNATANAPSTGVTFIRPAEFRKRATNDWAGSHLMQEFMCKLHENGYNMCISYVFRILSDGKQRLTSRGNERDYPGKSTTSGRTGLSDGG
jgi:hypothetical protein